MTMQELDEIRDRSTRAKATYQSAKTGCCYLCGKWAADPIHGAIDELETPQCLGRYVAKCEEEERYAYFLLCREVADRAVAMWIAQGFK